MKLHTTLALLIAGAFVSSSAHAQTEAQIEARYSRDYGSCMKTGDAADGVTSGIMDCTGEEIGRQDARLNQAYKMVMARLNSEQKTSLRTSERNWIVARDARCAKSSNEEDGGSLAAIIYSGCILRETVKRTMWIEAYK